MNNRYFSGFWGYLSPKKAGPTLSERIERVLAGGRSIVGRGDLQKELWPSGWTLEDTADLNRTLNRMIQDGRVIETRREVPGAHDFPAVSEYVYSLGREPERTGKVRKLAPDGETWLVYKNGQLIDEYPVD